MATTSVQTRPAGPPSAIPSTMQAAVYYGRNDVRVQAVPVPEIGPGELLVQVASSGVCGTDLKKIATGSHSAPHIFGHETAGTVVAVGAGVRDYAVGDRIAFFHHVPCGDCYYCRRKEYSQCGPYKNVGVTAGFEPSGGGFAQYVRIMDWVAQRGVVRVPADVSLERACFIEPLNTCLKAVEKLAIRADDTVLVIGAGPIGTMLAALARRTGAHVAVSDLFPERLAVLPHFGITTAIHAGKEDVQSRVRELTEGRGADVVILAVGGNSLIRPAIDAARAGGKVMLFAQTQHGDVAIDAGAICVDEKTLMGSYSSSVDLNDECARLIFSGELPVERLISHRFPLAQAVEAFQLAANPQPGSMKIMIEPPPAH